MSRTARSEKGLKLATIAVSMRPAWRTTRSARDASFQNPRPYTLSSTMVRKLAGSASKTSPSVGMRSPARPCTSSCFSSASERRAAGPVPLVVRSSPGSCKTTTSPSRDSRTSSSTPSAPASTAARNAATVFSGAADVSPRCAMISGRPRSDAGRIHPSCITIP